MENTYLNRGGWFDGRQDSTGASSCLVNLPKYILAAGMFASLGTGAFTDDLSRLRQAQIRESLVPNRVQILRVGVTSVRGPVEEIDRIRTVIAPTMSALAKSFNVSRQTIYNWMNGERPTVEHGDKLRDLALAADIFADAGIPVNGVLLKRKVIGGKNLLEVVSDGGSAQDASRLLVQIVRLENSQREILATRFAGRIAPHSAIDSDLMATNDRV
jgi:transcriptional regulator with XRE-family HTH domain